MNSGIAVLLLIIGAPLLLLAMGVAVLAMRNERQQRLRTDAAVRERLAIEEALLRLAQTTLPAITDSVRRHEIPQVGVEMPAELAETQAGQALQWIATGHAEDLRAVAEDTRAMVERYSEQRRTAEVQAAHEQAGNELSAASRAATSAAVRSFGTSVVSLGTDLGQVVSTALREHRDDAIYETLTRIDHTVQQMIRQAQSYVIVSGGLPGRRWPQQSLTDVVGGATGRVREFLRVRSGQSDRVVISRAVEPLVHTLATLLDNALRYSPPSSFVEVGFQEGHHGVTVIIDDAGMRMSPEQLEDARQVLSGERPVDIHDLGPAPKVGFPGIAALARRYGFSVHVDGPNIFGGMRAMVYVPAALLVSGAAPRLPEPELTAPAHVPVPVPDLVEPERGAEVHEITSGGLPKRRRRPVAPDSAGAATEEAGQARPELAAAWHSGSRSGRAAAAERTTEGTADEHTGGR
ncbi:sensor histidine kinase [Nocardia sp. AG03]|uniref:sensor histidine kinase n=1 Tax=Nocardia sp. AG03 TaxID=3025312 RepID=UPI0024187FDB|nr:sensor histidine kinase [Nocardia sp. AG03]